MGNTGTVENHKVFDTFGNLTNYNPYKDVVFGFTGKLFDEATGLQNNLNRWYDPTVGLWISEDPIGFDAGDANLGRYVGGMPTIYTDPSGLKSSKPGGSTNPQAGPWLGSLPPRKGGGGYYAVFIDWEDGKPISGHAAVGIFDPDTGQIDVIGHYPTVLFPPPGRYSLGQINDDSVTRFRSGRAWPITQQNYNNLRKLFNTAKKQKPKYNPTDQNCTTFANWATQKAGVPFEFPESQTTTPGDDINRPTYLPVEVGPALEGWPNGSIYPPNQ